MWSLSSTGLPVACTVVTNGILTDHGCRATATEDSTRECLVSIGTPGDSQDPVNSKQNCRYR